MALYAGRRCADHSSVDVVLLGWDPDRGSHWVPPFDRVLTQLATTGRATAPWSLGPSGVAPRPGVVVHLMVQGRQRGLIGRGIVRSSPYRALDPARRGTMALHVIVEWDHLRPIEDRITLEQLEADAPDLPWRETYAPMSDVPPPTAAALDLIWAAASEHPSPTGATRAAALLSGALHAVLHPSLTGWH